MYRLLRNDIEDIIRKDMIYKINGSAFVPSDITNIDYQQFKIDVASGVELQDPDGNVMTQQEVNDFLKTIP